MPLAAPVTMADLPCSCIAVSFVSRRFGFQIVDAPGAAAHWTKGQLLHRRCAANLATRFSLRHIGRHAMFNNSRFAQGLFILVAATALGLPRPALAQGASTGST